MQARWTFAILVALILFFSARSAPRAKAEAKPVVQKTAFEHLAMNVPVGERLSTPETAKKINELGRQGWQLVDVETMVKDGTTTKMVYFFKRQK